jgi:hypothetical protein
MGGGSSTSTSKSTSNSKSTTQIPTDIRKRGGAITGAAMASYFDPAARYQPFSMSGIAGGQGQASGGYGGGIYSGNGVNAPSGVTNAYAQNAALGGANGDGAGQNYYAGQGYVAPPGGAQNAQGFWNNAYAASNGQPTSGTQQASGTTPWNADYYAANGGSPPGYYIANQRGGGTSGAGDDGNDGGGGQSGTGYTYSDGGVYGTGGASNGGVGVGGQAGGPTGLSYGEIGNERTADFNDWHNVAGQGLQEAQDVYKPYFNQATGAAVDASGNRASGPVQASTGATYNPDGSVNFAEYNADTMRRFMNPFTQNVTDVGMAELQRQHQLAQMGINNQSALSGAFGGGRHGIQAAETTRGFADMGQKFLSDSLSQAFNNAQGQYNTERGALFQQTGLNNQSAGQNFNQGINYANFLEGQGKDWQNAALTGSNAANTFGNQIMGRDQQVRDRAYEAYKDARDYPMETYERLQGINAMQPGNRTTITTGSTTGSQTTPTPGWGGAALGAVGQALPVLATMSDERTKENVENVNPEKVLSAFSKIEPKAYDYKSEVRARYPDLTAPGRRTGFMAQDYERAFGTKTREVDGIKTLDLPEIMGRLVVAVNGLEKRTRGLKKKAKG